MENIEVGDLVDVAPDFAYGVYPKVRVLELVDDVAKASGIDPDELDAERAYGGDPHSPGFLGRVEEDNGDYDAGDEIWVTMDEVVPGSKNKYHFAEGKKARKITLQELRRLIKEAASDDQEKIAEIMTLIKHYGYIMHREARDINVGISNYGDAKLREIEKLLQNLVK
jgi:hypothetical protein